MRDRDSLKLSGMSVISEKDNHGSSENRMERSHLCRPAMEHPQWHLRKSSLGPPWNSEQLAPVMHSIPLNMHGIPSMANSADYVTKGTVSRLNK